MSTKEVLGEGPLFLTIKKVRGEPMMKQLEDKIKMMKSKNVIRSIFMKFYLYIKTKK